MSFLSEHCGLQAGRGAERAEHRQKGLGWYWWLAEHRQKGLGWYWWLAEHSRKAS